MAFRTKLDYSDNRQIKQFEKSHTVLSGGTSFGLTFNSLTSGPDLTTSADTETYTTLASTFSGNGTTTIYTWYDPIMAIAGPYLSAITPSLSATTQLIEEPVFSAVTTTIIDGNTVGLLYTGVTFDITPISFYNLGGGNYSGTVETLDLTTYSASSLDYTGRTIWVDVSGITRTERLIVTNEPQIGYVLTCYTSEGMAKWDAVTGVTISGGSILWSAGTGTYSIAAKNHNSIASGDYSVAHGYNTKAIGLYSHAEGQNTTASGNSSHAEGYFTIASGVYGSHSEGVSTIASNEGSHAEGGQTTASGYYSHAEGSNTIASNVSSHAEGYNATASGQYSHAEGYITTASGHFGAHAEGGVSIASGNFSHAEGNQTTASNTASHAEGVLTTASGLYSHAEGYNTTAIGQSSHAEGNQTLALGSNSHAGGNQSTASGVTSFVHGLNSNAGGSATIVLGSGITGTTDNTTYVNKLNIKTLGTYADNAAATSAGLEVGTVYKTSTGQLMIRY